MKSVLGFGIRPMLKWSGFEVWTHIIDIDQHCVGLKVLKDNHKNDFFCLNGGLRIEVLKSLIIFFLFWKQYCVAYALIMCKSFDLVLNFLYIGSFWHQINSWFWP